MLDRRSFARSSLALLGGAALTRSAWADTDFPRAPIRFIAGSPPGGSTDAVARLLTAGLSGLLPQPGLVVNMSGAGGNVATEYVAHSPGDGYTILVGGNFSHGIGPALYKDSKYDPIKDFTPIIQVANLPTIVAVSPRTGITSLAELIRRAKANPGKLNYGSSGSGSPSHLSAESLKRLAGIELTHVPYRGGAPSALAALAGDVDILVGTPPVITPYLPDKRLTALCVTWPQRYAVLPDIPSSAEAGLPQLAIQHWFGLWAAAGVPADARQKLFVALSKVLKDPENQAKLARQGLMASPSASSADFEAFVKREIPIWKQRTIESGATSA
ncbi:tripartite tricarboxylate transporter substrate binding protein [Ramlibacter sp.]|jgi:tripartite-type tricarboxylate transporter receptor subunit TctC|uniref:Bug family tripartite tricarboxylate transporter substrate binding protein n=1 Tax=Ramlibacter sp. TaxID=1917967 RepID=UPI002633999B|nr:tripartite tricarboxylate transporter substrate binding protein [Ramlibacter sp.]MDB5954579.1 transporter substrate-binding protein [Ramlibacter sp.]